MKRTKFKKVVTPILNSMIVEIYTAGLKPHIGNRGAAQAIKMPAPVKPRLSVITDHTAYVTVKLPRTNATVRFIINQKDNLASCGIRPFKKHSNDFFIVIAHRTGYPLANEIHEIIPMSQFKYAKDRYIQLLNYYK